jgi:putative SOS response-associated peptidase YedK
MRQEKKVTVFAKNKAGVAVMKEMHHGLIPAHFTGYLSDWGASTTHARLETVATTDAFSNAWTLKRRVIFPLECYYGKARLGSDLLGSKGKAERVAIKRADEFPLGVAGIYDYAQLADGALLSAAMLTREPGKRMYAIHDREPVVLEPQDWQAWLDGSETLDLATPWSDDAFMVVPAGQSRNARRAG